MANRGIIGPAIKLVVLATLIFFFLYFLVPESSQRFFGTSIMDAHIEEVGDAVVEEVMSIDPAITVEQAKELISSPAFRQILLQVQDVGSEAVDQAAEIAIEYIKQDNN